MPKKLLSSLVFSLVGFLMFNKFPVITFDEGEIIRIDDTVTPIEEFEQEDRTKIRSDIRAIDLRKEVDIMIEIVRQFQLST